MNSVLKRMQDDMDKLDDRYKETLEANHRWNERQEEVDRQLRDGTFWNNLPDLPDDTKPKRNASTPKKPVEPAVLRIVNEKVINKDEC